MQNSIAHAQAPQKQHAATDSTQAEPVDPFGADDPFAVINTTQVPSPSRGDAPHKAAHQPDAQAAVYFKTFRYGVNDDSRINPANRIDALKDNNDAVETRMTLADYFDGQQSWRWLFKGYASTSNPREPENTPRRQARIDELFTDWKYQDWFASIGKRRINWGHAQGFNPVNVVAPARDPLNPGYETEGRSMAWLSRAGRVTLDVVVTRNADQNGLSDQRRWGMRLGSSGIKSDYAVYYFDGAAYGDGQVDSRMLGASFSANVMPGLTAYLEAADFAHNNRNYYDAGTARLRKDGSYFQGVMGSSIDLGGKSSLFVEYLRNGQGYSSVERKNFLSAADARLAVDSDKALVRDFIALSMNRGYLLTAYKKEYRENYFFNLSILVAADRSSSTRAALAYALSDYYEFRTSYLHNAGDRDSEFGNSPYTGLFEIGFNASF